MTPEEREEQLRLENIKRGYEYAEQAEAAAAKAQQQRETEEQAALVQEIRDNAPAVAAVEADRQGEETGATKFMEDAAYVLQGKWVNDALHAIAPDTFKTTEELEATKAQTLQDIKDGKVGGMDQFTFGTLNNIDAALGGAQAGGLTPIALPFVLTGQDTSWNEAPEIIKDSIISKSIYDVSKVVAPSLAFTAAGLPLTTGQQYLLESGIETLGSQDPDDYLLSRTAAKSVGQIANSMGLDGGEITRNLLEGNGIGYRVAGIIAGGLHNLGINITTDKLFGPLVRKLGGAGKNIDPALEQVAKDSGKPLDEVVETVSKRAEPGFNTAKEPLDNVDASTAVNAIQGDAPEGVSPLGFLYNILGQQNDSIARRPFFLSVNGFTGGDKGLIRTVNILTDHMDRFPLAAQTKARMAIEAVEYLSANSDLVKRPTAQFLQDFSIKYANGIDLSKITSGQAKALNYEMVKGAVIAPQGALIGALGMRSANQEAIDLSRQIMTSESAGIDWTESLPALKDIVETMETWGSIYRQNQQLWHIGGEFEQDAFQEGILTGKGLSKFFKSATKWARYDKGIYGKPEELFNVAAPYLAENQHFTKLIQSAIDGNQQAKAVVRDIVGIMSVQNAANPVDISTMTSDRMVQAFVEGNKGSIPRIWMSLNLLGRFRSAFKALGATALRNLTQQISATAGIAAIKLQTDPKALLKAQTYNDHIALFTGQAMMLQDSLRVAVRSAQTNKPIMEAKTRWKGSMGNLNEQLVELNEKFNLTVTELARRGELTPTRKMALVTSLLFRKVALNPVVNIVPRGLMAQDEGFKVMAGASYANMLAGRKRLDPQFTGYSDDELFQLSLKEVFQDGDPMQGFALTAGEARDYADFLTLQREITPKQGDFVSGEGLRASGVVNAAFRGLEAASEESAIFAWANPFVRMAWEITNQASTQLTGAIPGGPAIANFVDPDFRATLRGDRGLAAKLELESNLAAGFANGWIMAGAAMAGWVTVTNFDPKRGEQGSAMKIQLPGMREPLEVGLQSQDPGILTLGMVAVLTNEFRDGAISYGDYQTGIFNVFKNYGVGLLDQNVLLGMTNITELLDHRNFNEGIASTLGKVVGGLVSIGPARMIADWTGGYVIPRDIEGDPIGNFGRNFVRTTGLDLVWQNNRTPMTNPWTGELQATRAMPEDPTFIERVTSGMIQEAVPFRVTRSTIEGSLAKKAYKYGWQLNGNIFKKAEGAMPFENIEQIAQFSKDFQDPRFGDFRGKMKAVLSSKTYTDAVKLYERLRAKNEEQNKLFGFLPAPQDAKEKNLLEAINAMKDKAVTDAQRDALMKGALAPWYKNNKLEAEQQENPFYEPQAQLNGRTEGLYAQAAKQDTPFAQQVRAILDIA